MDAAPGPRRSSSCSASSAPARHRTCTRCGCVCVAALFAPSMLTRALQACCIRSGVVVALKIYPKARGARICCVVDASAIRWFASRSLLLTRLPPWRAEVAVRAQRPSSQARAADPQVRRGAAPLPGSADSASRRAVGCITPTFSSCTPCLRTTRLSISSCSECPLRARRPPRVSRVTPAPVRYVPRGDLFHELKRCGGCFSERCVTCAPACERVRRCVRADLQRAQARHP